MSLTKRSLELINETKLAEQKKTCACFYNWDDKFEVFVKSTKLRKMISAKKVFHLKS